MEAEERTREALAALNEVAIDNDLPAELRCAARELAAPAAYFYGIRRRDSGGLEDEVAKFERVPLSPAERRLRSAVRRIEESLPDEIIRQTDVISDHLIQQGSLDSTFACIEFRRKCEESHGHKCLECSIHYYLCIVERFVQKVKPDISMPVSF